MKITFEITDRRDVTVAADHLAALSHAYRLLESRARPMPAPEVQSAMVEPPVAEPPVVEPPVVEPPVAEVSSTVAEPPVAEVSSTVAEVNLATPVKRRGRKPGSKNKPRAQANGQSPSQEASNATTDPVTTASNGHDTPDPTDQPDLFTDIANAREQLRQVAIEKGVLWIREILSAASVARLSDLPDSKVQELVRAA